MPHNHKCRQPCCLSFCGSASPAGESIRAEGRLNCETANTSREGYRAILQTGGERLERGVSLVAMRSQRGYTETSLAPRIFSAPKHRRNRVHQNCLCEESGSFGSVLRFHSECPSAGNLRLSGSRCLMRMAIPAGAMTRKKKGTRTSHESNVPMQPAADSTRPFSLSNTRGRRNADATRRILAATNAAAACVRPHSHRTTAAAAGSAALAAARLTRAHASLPVRGAGPRLGHCHCDLGAGFMSAQLDSVRSVRASCGSIRFSGTTQPCCGGRSHCRKRSCSREGGAALPC